MSYIDINSGIIPTKYVISSYNKARIKPEALLVFLAFREFGGSEGDCQPNHEKNQNDEK